MFYLFIIIIINNTNLIILIILHWSMFLDYYSKFGHMSDNDDLLLFLSFRLSLLICWLAAVTCESAWRRSNACFCRVSFAGKHSATLTELSRGQSVLYLFILPLCYKQKVHSLKNSPFTIWRDVLKLLTLIALNLSWEQVWGLSPWLSVSFI